MSEPKKIQVKEGVYVDPPSIEIGSHCKVIVFSEYWEGYISGIKYSFQLPKGWIYELTTEEKSATFSPSRCKYFEEIKDD